MIRHTDLLSTVISPVTVAYIVYLIYQVAGEGKAIPTFGALRLLPGHHRWLTRSIFVAALIMLAAIYGCQMVIYILHRKFEHIGEQMAPLEFPGRSLTGALW